MRIHNTPKDKNNMQHTLFKLSLGLLAACSASESTGTATADAGAVADGAVTQPAFDPVECRPVVAQSDFVSQNPAGAELEGVAPYWFGPGVDQETGKPAVAAGSIMTTTYLQLRTDPASLTRFGELSGPVVGAMLASPGFVATLIVSSPKCGVARTLTIWKDEEAMIDFVASDAHSQAISSVSEVSRGGSITMNWIAAGPEDATYAVAAEKLKLHTGPVY